MNNRQWISVALVMVLLFLTLPTSAALDEGIHIKDPALDFFIRREIGKPDGLILRSDVEDLRTIDTTT